MPKCPLQPSTLFASFICSSFFFCSWASQQTEFKAFPNSLTSPITKISFLSNHFCFIFSVLQQAGFQDISLSCTSATQPGIGLPSAPSWALSPPRRDEENITWALTCPNTHSQGPFSHLLSAEGICQLVTIWMNDQHGTLLLEGWTRLCNISEMSQIWALNTSLQNRSGQQAGAAMPNSRELAPSREVALISNFDTADPKLWSEVQSQNIALMVLTPAVPPVKLQKHSLDQPLQIATQATSHCQKSQASLLPKTLHPLAVPVLLQSRCWSFRFSNPCQPEAETYELPMAG